MSREKLGRISLQEKELEALINYASQDAYCIFLDSHQHRDPYGKYEKVLAWGAQTVFLSQHDTKPSELYQWQQEIGDWCFGALNYEIKKNLEGLNSPQADPLEWSLFSFFQPQHLLLLERGAKDWLFESTSLNQGDLTTIRAREKSSFSELEFQTLISKDQYLKDVRSLLKEIQFGNIYEINYCQTWEANGPVNATELFLKKNKQHQAPFSALLRFDYNYALCFSPERYLRLEADKVISQPIKGTAARKVDPKEDAEAQAALLHSEKERAENVMIVDLVRNDLSRTAKKGSVKVEELFGLYSFNAVHQMISTISSSLDTEKYHWGQLIETSFPMGSMTGAPKYSAMQLIDGHEHFQRGLYSGSIGYIDPQGNFDFNVVIRSLLHNETKNLSRISVGSAITIHCDPEQEYAECLLKAEKLLD